MTIDDFFKRKNLQTKNLVLKLAAAHNSLEKEKIRQNSFQDEFSIVKKIFEDILIWYRGNSKNLEEFAKRYTEDFLLLSYGGNFGKKRDFSFATNIEGAAVPSNFFLDESTLSFNSIKFGPRGIDLVNYGISPLVNQDDIGEGDLADFMGNVARYCDEVSKYDGELGGELGEGVVGSDGGGAGRGSERVVGGGGSDGAVGAGRFGERYKRKMLMSALACLQYQNLRYLAHDCVMPTDKIASFARGGRFEQFKGEELRQEYLLALEKRMNLFYLLFNNRDVEKMFYDQFAGEDLNLLKRHFEYTKDFLEEMGVLKGSSALEDAIGNYGV